MRKRIEPKVYASEAAFLDPADCGSVVAYCVTARRRLSGTVDLSDCNRKITWYFGNDESGVRKIDKAIAMLQNFKTAFVAAQRSCRRRRR